VKSACCVPGSLRRKNSAPDITNGSVTVTLQKALQHRYRITKGGKYKMTFNIKADHQTAELERLAAGYDGCGCADCQTFYKTLDLEKYGKRVVRFQDTINITAGPAGADKWPQYHQKAGGTPEPTPPVKRASLKQGVLSQPVKEIIPTASAKTTSIEQTRATKHGGGRPRIDRGYSKRTEYRRKAEQGVLVQ
jgi:hypothetical protein